MADEQPKITRRERGKRISVPILGFSMVEFTGHALDQMKIRGITEDEVIDTIRNPTETGLPTQPNRHRVRRNKNARIAIDVVYEKEEDDRTLLIVTAIEVQRRLERHRRLAERRKK